MTPTAFRPCTLLVFALGLLGTGCSISSEVTAVTFRSENGTVVGEEWNGAAECRVRPGTESPCLARTSRQSLEAVVVE